MIHFHKWTKWSYLRKDAYYDGNETSPYKRTKTFERECTVCGIPKVKTVRA